MHTCTYRIEYNGEFVIGRQVIGCVDAFSFLFCFAIRRIREGSTSKLSKTKAIFTVKGIKLDKQTTGTIRIWYIYSFVVIYYLCLTNRMIAHTHSNAVSPKYFESLILVQSDWAAPKLILSTTKTSAALDYLNVTFSIVFISHFQTEIQFWGPKTSYKQNSLIDERTKS